MANSRVNLRKYTKPRKHFPQQEANEKPSAAQKIKALRYGKQYLAIMTALKGPKRQTFLQELSEALYISRGL